MTWTKEREDEIRSRWAGHSSDVDAVFSWLDAEREARQRAEALLATIDKHTAHNDPMQVTASALARSIQRAERERDELLSDWKEIDALPPVRAAFEEGMRLVDAVAKAIADVHYAEGTPLFDAEVAKSFAEHERDEARAERDAIAAQLATLREAAERYAEVAEVPAGHLDTIQDLARDALRAALADLPGAVRERKERSAFDLADWFDAKARWSAEVFGPETGPQRYEAVVAHIRKELVEIERDPADLEEWCDVVMLAMDGAWRSAGADGAAFVAMLEGKHAINLVRVWRRDDDGVIEHVREEVAVLEDDGDPA